MITYPVSLSDTSAPAEILYLTNAISQEPLPDQPRCRVDQRRGARAMLLLRTQRSSAE